MLTHKQRIISNRRKVARQRARVEKRFSNATPEQRVAMARAKMVLSRYALWAVGSTQVRGQTYRENPAYRPAYKGLTPRRKRQRSRMPVERVDR